MLERWVVGRRWACLTSACYDLFPFVGTGRRSCGCLWSVVAGAGSWAVVGCCCHWLFIFAVGSIVGGVVWHGIATLSLLLGSGWGCQTCCLPHWRWRCGPASVVKKGEERVVRWLTWLSVVWHHSSIVGWYIINSDVAPVSCMERG